MSVSPRSTRQREISLVYVLLCLFVGVIWIAGGASRADAPGQALVRSASAAVLIVLVLFGERRPLGAGRPAAIFLGVTVLLAVLQLIPLPPSMWQALPGRALIAQAALAVGEPQPWRPLTLVPGATVNAAASLVVPIATLALLVSIDEAERVRLPGLLLIMVGGAVLLGLLQFSGAGFRDPLVNTPAVDVGGPFANRNHFALLLAFGCLVAPPWAFLGRRRPGWRVVVALASVPLLVLTILASGSRAGVLLGGVGLALGLTIAWRGLRRALARYPRWTFVAVLLATVGLIVLLVGLSIAADRAVSIDRMFQNDPGQDMRGQALSTVNGMIWAYFPAGSGLGGFDPVFRISEPFGLLRLTYLNHAHDDWLEIALDAGAPGLLLLLAGVAWWGRTSLRAWRLGEGEDTILPRLGSAALLLVLLASAIDYPARTPFIMMIVVIAAYWLAGAGRRRHGSALP